MEYQGVGLRDRLLRHGDDADDERSAKARADDPERAVTDVSARIEAHLLGPSDTTAFRLSSKPEE